MSHDPGWSDLAASFALDALDVEERRNFERHLAECAVCQADVRAYRESAALLASGVRPRQPPVTLRDRILAEARQVRPISFGAIAVADGPGQPEPPPARARGASIGGLRWLAAAAAVVAIASSAFLLRESMQRRSLESTVATLTEETQRLDSRVAELDRAVAERDSLLSAVLAPDVRIARLAAQGTPPSARIYWDRTRGRVVLAAFDLPPAPSGRTYQLWGIAGGRDPVSLGVFNTSAGGRSVTTFEVDPSLGIDVAAVTEEPAGGSPQPTTTPFLVGGISSP